LGSPLELKSLKLPRRNIIRAVSPTNMNKAVRTLKKIVGRQLMVATPF